MTSTSAQSYSIKNEMKALVCLILIPVLHPRFQRLPFGLEAEDGQLDIWEGFAVVLVISLLFEHVSVRSLAFLLMRVAFILLCSQPTWVYLQQKLKCHLPAKPR